MEQLLFNSLLRTQLYGSRCYDFNITLRCKWFEPFLLGWRAQRTVRQSWHPCKQSLRNLMKFHHPTLLPGRMSPGSARIRSFPDGPGWNGTWWLRKMTASFSIIAHFFFKCVIIWTSLLKARTFAIPGTNRVLPDFVVNLVGDAPDYVFRIVGGQHVYHSSRGSFNQIE